MPDTTVKYFDSTMSGAPALSGTEGTLISVLDACLVNGFGSVTLDSLVVASNVATATVGGGHNLAMVGATGPVVRIEGATPAGLNGDWRVTVTSSTQFTFTTSGITDQTASGTITAKRAPAGFSKAFSGTNKAAYQADDVQSTRLYLRVDDTGTTSARIRGYEAMTDVDTGTGLFPTDAQLSGGGYVYKANGTNRPWALYSDGRLIYFFCDSTNNGAWTGGFVFGDIDSYAVNDEYKNLLIYSITSSGNFNLYLLNSSTGSVLARAYTKTGGSITSWRLSHGGCSSLGAGGQAYPSPIDLGIHLWPVECWEAAGARGLMPGLWGPVHNGTLPHKQEIYFIPNLPGRTLLSQVTGTAGNQGVIDLTGPWRS